MVSQSLSNQYLADPDVQLMLRVAADDHDAFEQLVERYQDRLIGFFFHLGQDRSAAEDLAQDVFLRIYRAKDRYSARARFSTWLFRIARNLVSNKRRGEAQKKEVDFGPDRKGSRIQPAEHLVAERSALMPSRQMATLEVRENVRAALDSLGERQKMAVLLHKFEGMSYADIADIMDLNIVAVKSLLARAHGNLRAALEKHL